MENRELVEQMTLYKKALKTSLAGRFVARAEDLGRELTDVETKVEARYQLEDLPYKPDFEGAELKKAIKEMKSLLK
ncbi:MAG: hypothetical protein K6F35_08020 [Lachnospiraceae bacterium]|nr:hypothetical protein [Lachnospiraceae bacterium]